MSSLDIARGEQLLKVRQIAAMLNISLAKVYRLIQRGEIPVVRIGHAVRVLPADLQEYATRSYSAYSEEWS